MNGHPDLSLYWLAETATDLNLLGDRRWLDLAHDLATAESLDPWAAEVVETHHNPVDLDVIPAGVSGGFVAALGEQIELEWAEWGVVA